MATLSNYKSDVLQVNASLKTELKSLNGAIRVLLLLGDLKPYQREMLNKALTDKELYSDMAKMSVNKSGNYRPFKVLNYTYQNSK